MTLVIVLAAIAALTVAGFVLSADRRYWTAEQVRRRIGQDDADEYDRTGIG